MTKREEIQAEITQDIINNEFEGIINVAPRVGKTKCIIDALKKMDNLKILISTPRKSVEESWNKEFVKWCYQNANIKIINKASLHKEKTELYDITILDEVHDLSINQIQSIKKIKKNGSKIFGMSGSLSEKSKETLKKELDLDVISEYTIEQAIKDGIISNYNINVIKVPMNNIVKYVKGGTIKYPKMVTEQEYYNYLTKKIVILKSQIEKNLEAGLSIKKELGIKRAYEMKRMNHIYTVSTKKGTAKRLIESIDERMLVFTARTAIADELCDHSYHSKSPKGNLQLFKDGEIDKLAVCSMASMGITVPDLKVGVIHQILSNEENTIQKLLRMCNLEGDKEAQIYITVVKDTVDEKWLESSLKPFPEEKINYLT